MKSVAISDWIPVVTVRCHISTKHAPVFPFAIAMPWVSFNSLKLLRTREKKLITALAQAKMLKDMAEAGCKRLAKRIKAAEKLLEAKPKKVKKHVKKAATPALKDRERHRPIQDALRAVPICNH